MARTILLADDSPTIRKVVELTFSDTDIRVEAVGNGTEAMERLDRLNPDLVLADVVMPEPSGYEICQAVKRSARPVPVVLLAGSFEPFDDDRARDCGADGHLIKPFESQTLLERVEALLAQNSSQVRASQSAEVEEALEDLAVADAAEEEATPGVEVEPGAQPAEGEAAVEQAEQEEVVGAATAGAEPDSGTAVAEESAADKVPLTPDELDAIARAVVERLSDQVLREIAWEVVPDLARTIIRERLRQLERDATE